MKIVCIIFCLLSFSFTAFGGTSVYRATLGVDFSSGLVGGYKEPVIVIAGPGLVDSVTGKASEWTSMSVRIPFDGLSQIRLANLETFVEPMALAAMIEEALNSRRVTIEQVQKFLSSSDWLAKGDRSFIEKLFEIRTCSGVFKFRGIRF